MNQSETAKLPPMLLQYREYKERYPECLLLFQVGDFYEVFFEDAPTVAKALNLTLTSRDKNSPNPIPMCGVPIAVIDSYLERLVNQGFSVALVSQDGEPTGKGMVPRVLDRIVTPGVRILGGAAAGGRESVVLSIYLESMELASMAFTDLQSGVVWAREGVPLMLLIGEVMKVQPTEVIIYHKAGTRQLDRRLQWVRSLEQRVGSEVKWRGESYIEALSHDQVSGLTSLSPSGRKATRLLLSYIEETTVDVHASVSEVRVKHYDDVMTIDATTRANLELVRPLREGNEAATLYSVLNHTVTIGGARLLRHWIVNPLTRVEGIQARLEAVRGLRSATTPRESLRDILQRSTDIERISTRISLAIASPLELGALRDLADSLPHLRNSLLQHCEEYPSELLSTLAERLGLPEEASLLLTTALVDNPPASLNDGGYIREGYDEELDKVRHLREKGKSWIAEFEAEERKRTGISSLKIRYNGVLGYFIEVTTANVGKVPPEYVRRQSTATSERFYLPTLKEMEEQVLGAEQRQIAREKYLFNKVRDALKVHVVSFRNIAEAIATLDVLLTFALVAERYEYTEPLVTAGDSLTIEEGRHPVIGALLGSRFVPNSLSLDTEVRCHVITGPNMGGKSTYLRQAALIAILAQIGSFVPAKRAEIGVVDKIFARIGASDDMTEGESTFMVEMRETASIISQATSRSLVLIDEIGRGTSTTDGLSIARAILEWIVTKVKSRTLFATHFHELTEFGQLFKEVGNLSVGSYEDGDDVLFTHEIKEGAANRSYGIEVAKLAGFPPALLSRARQFLQDLDKERAPSRQLQLFAPQLFNRRSDEQLESERREFKRREEKLLQQVAELKDKLAAYDINRMTPLDALNALNLLQQEITGAASDE